ncbi:MAG TPA: two-component regulator propeller domain-containing protein, partial [Flavobacteriales bacterium]|nr:two-component regulator propeller domain-containing protein [Flavobacteriales bacterium]
MHRLLVASLFVLLLRVIPSFAQQYDLRTLSLEQGLPSMGINALCLDHEGFLWVGTMLGAARCDGSRFETVAGTENREVTALLCDHNGVVWIGTANRRVGRWVDEHFAYMNTAKGSAAITSFCETEQGIYWSTAGDGVLWMKDVEGAAVQLKSGFSSLIVRTLVCDADQRVIAGTDSGPFELKGDTWTPLEASKALPRSRVNTLFADSSGVLIGTDAGFAELDRKLLPPPLTQRFLGAYPISLPDVHATAILRATNGDIWMGTPSGLLHLSREGGVPTLRSIRSTNGLGHDQVRCLLEDRSGVIWIGTGFGGLSRFTSEAFLHFTDRDGLGSRTVTAIHRTPDHLLYLATAGG